LEPARGGGRDRQMLGKGREHTRWGTKKEDTAPTPKKKKREVIPGQVASNPPENIGAAEESRKNRGLHPSS